LSKIDFPSGFLSKIIRVASRSEKNGPLFRVGEILQGRVVEQIDDHHAILQIKGENLWVENHIPLSKNMEGFFRVETTDPQVILKLISEEERVDQPIASWLKKYFSSDFSLEDFSEELLSLREMRTDAIPPQVRDTLEHLFTLFDRFSIGQPFSLDPNRLEEIVIRSGLFLEQQLRHLVETHTKDECHQIVMEDLKGLLIKLRAQLRSLFSTGGSPGSSSSVSKEIESGLEKILNKIEAYQLLNLTLSQSQGKIFLLLPLWFENNLQFVEMNISLPRFDSDRSEQEGISIFFLLNLPGWGRMSVKVKMRGKGFYARFEVSNPAVSAFLSRAFPELQARLNQLGFQPQLSISVGTTEKMAQALLSEIGEESESLLNIVI
jgi:hypothetical protein